MIDSHCHLEQNDYDKDRDSVIRACRNEGIRAAVTSCARLPDFGKTLEIANKHSDFAFPVFGIHPEFIKDVSPSDVDTFMEKVKGHKDRVFGIGEVGLDYNWIRDPGWREKQKDLFIQMIGFAKEIRKPVVVHSRDAYEDSLRILEQQDARDVQLHMFGDNRLVGRVIEDGYFVSINAIVLRSKKHRKIARDMPMDRLMLETDAPWLDPDGGRNDPRTIRRVAEKIADIRKVDFEEVWKASGRNAVSFFNLPVKL
ncbi:MAG: hypothetical protein DRO99_00790 [Candidatus Aenigmatarchaeota archaeon]|nr:MAG: hypothetical protein DRO99_00790 [Candidatus Aenigmarchaeota archaeon]